MQERNSSTAEERRAARVDVIGHSGVQPWSAGPIFPCVIARVERYSDRPSKAAERGMRAAFGWADHDVLMRCEDPAARLLSVSYELIAYGRREEYATHEDAEMVARALNADEVLRAKWRGDAFLKRGGCVWIIAGSRDQSGVAL